MGYADGLLATGERIVHREKQHWFVFVWGARGRSWRSSSPSLLLVRLILGQASTGSSGTVLDPGRGRDRVRRRVVVARLDDPALPQPGVRPHQPARHPGRGRPQQARSTDSSLEKINDAVLTQSVFGRMFGFGDLDILTASESGISEFRMLATPIEFKKAMLDAKHEYELETCRAAGAVAPRSTPDGPTAAPRRRPPARPPSDADPPPALPAPPRRAGDDADEVTRTLASLADLRDRGAISARGVRAKKADLLGRL